MRYLRPALSGALVASLLWSSAVAGASTEQVTVQIVPTGSRDAVRSIELYRPTDHFHVIWTGTASSPETEYSIYWTGEDAKKTARRLQNLEKRDAAQPGVAADSPLNGINV